MKKLIAVLCLIQAAAARADWPADAGLDVPVSNVGTAETPTLIADQQDGVFVVFTHQDSTPSSTLRGEHFNAAGDRLWGTPDVDGGFIGKDLLGLSLGANNNGKALAFTDELGGFIAVYAPGKSGGPYTADVQRFDDTGAPQWAATGAFGGVEMLSNPYYFSPVWGVSDQTGGALVVYAPDTNGEIGQRVDSTGAIAWGGGVTFSGAQTPNTAYPLPYLNGDGNGGMYYIWPNTGSSNSSPLIDHFDPAGNKTFEVPSVALQTAVASNWTAAGLPDGGGVWAAWYQNLGDAGIYLQLFANDGGAVFADGGAAGGIQIAPLAGAVSPDPTLMLDGTGGVVLAWSDSAGGSTYVVYAQRFGADGAPLWGAHPLIVNSPETPTSFPSGPTPVYRVIPTADDNVGFFWNGSPGIYAEKIAKDGGSKLWGRLSGGVAVSTVAPGAVGWMDVTFAADDSAYVSYQNAGTEQIFIKHVNADGTLGASAPFVDAGPNDDGGIDAGVDAGPDSGVADSGPPEDAGTDAGPGDAGPTPDAGPDAGGQKPDSGVTPDAGGSPDGGSTTSSSSGCSCTSGGVGGPWEVALVAIGLVLARRRSKRRA